jgi:hypothetical protein
VLVGPEFGFGALPIQDILWHRKKVIISDVFIFPAVRISLLIYSFALTTDRTNM